LWRGDYIRPWGVARLNLTDSLKLIVGVRVSWHGYWNTSGVQTMKETGMLSPYGGIVYDPDKQFFSGLGENRPSFLALLRQLIASCDGQSV
jgi:hypothetical protein